MEVKGFKTKKGGAINIYLQKDGSVRTNLFGSMEVLTNDVELELVKKIIQANSDKEDYSDMVKELLVLRGMNYNDYIEDCESDQKEYSKINYTKDELEFMQEVIDDYIDFSKDLEFEPSIRNINCFAYACKKSLEFAKNYYVNRLKIVGGEWELAQEKVKSDEFDLLVEKFEVIRLSGNVINERLKIYFGIPGGGKTTQALKEANNNCILCNSSMLPSDLIEDFKLTDGKGNLIPSPLRHAMENGEKIVLDEIGTLTLDCLRLLQGLTDNKESFKYKDEEITIKKGFQIIGTMNLFINGTSYPLTEALGDRICYDGLEEFKLTSKKILDMAFM